MTAIDALAAAAVAVPEDDTVRDVYLDALEERDGTTPYIKAVREFVAKCREPRRYGNLPRRAISGWREWLMPQSGEWLGASTHGKLWARNVWGNNWPRLVPSLWSLLSGADRWRRKGGTVEVQTTQPHGHGPGGTRIGEEYLWDNNGTELSRVTRFARLTFARGWVQRVEFRDWQSADALLSAILADQPFVEAGIANIIHKRHRPQDAVCLARLLIGPVIDNLEGGAVTMRDGEIAIVMYYPQDARDGLTVGETARAALSTALIARFRAGEEGKP